MEATLTLSQAGRHLGVDDDALSRLIRMGALPEAAQQDGEGGPMWVIPARDLPLIAARNGWTIDLRGAEATITADEPIEAEPIEAELVETEPVEAELVEDGSTGVAGDADGNQPADPTDPADEAIVEAELVDETDSAVDESALVPQGDPGIESAVEAAGDETAVEASAGPPSVTEVIDLALLDRLLGAQEQRVVAEAMAQENRNALTALKQTHDRITSELEIERHERMVVTDRYREERLARAASDAKVTELRNRVTREMALAEVERQARSEAQDRSSAAERQAANAFASMGWLARRRFRRLNETSIVDPD